MQESLLFAVFVTFAGVVTAHWVLAKVEKRARRRTSLRLRQQARSAMARVNYETGSTS